MRSPKLQTKSAVPRSRMVVTESSKISRGKSTNGLILKAAQYPSKLLLCGNFCTTCGEHADFSTTETARNDAWLLHGTFGRAIAIPKN